MKKLLLLLLSTIMIISCCGCIEEEDPATADAERSQQFSESYDFYNDSIDVLKEKMELNTLQANSVFEILVDIGVDEKINYCFAKDDYYDVWAGLRKMQVYLSDGSVEKILQDETELYPTTLDSLIKWDEEENKGYLYFELEWDELSATVLTNYYLAVQDYLEQVNIDKLKEYEYIEFRGGIMKDGSGVGVIKGTLSMDYISNTENFSTVEIESRMTDVFIPGPLK